MSRLFTAILIFSLAYSAFSYDRQAAEQEIRFLSQNAHTYLTEVIIWVAVVSVLIFAMILCICDMTIRWIFARCLKDSKEVDVETASSRTARTSASKLDFFDSIVVPSRPDIA